jgi:hypothetical protein
MVTHLRLVGIGNLIFSSSLGGGGIRKIFTLSFVFIPGKKIILFRKFLPTS